MSSFMEMNMDVLRALAEWRTPFWTEVVRVITMFGEELIAIVLLSFIYWCVNKNLAYGIGTAFFISGNIVQGAKISFRIPRPWNLDPSFVAVEAEMNKVLTSYSFPSGHTQTAASIFGTLGFAAKNKLLKVVCFLLVLLVGFSRMYLGVHTPLDVVVALLLTLIIALIAAKLFCGEFKAGRDLFIMLFVVALSAGLLVLATSLNAGGAIDVHYMQDSCKQASAAIGFALGGFIERAFIKFETKTKHWWGQLLKYLCGIAGVLAIKEGLKLVIGTSVLMDSLRYFLMVFWVAAIFPLLVKLVSSKKGKVAK